MATTTDPFGGIMHAKEPEQYNSNPASLDHGSSDNGGPTAALNNHLLDTEGWAEKITKQGYIHESKVRLERRMTEFLTQADPAERDKLESSRIELLNLIKSAQAEREHKYPATTTETVLARRQVAQAKIRSGYEAFSEVAYEYSKVMDLLVEQAREYVSLVWGAIKIVLVVQINHEELKQKVKEYMERIKIRFEIVDHLTAYMPKANLVTSVAKAYESFSRFLAKAVKYYSLNRFKATWR